MIPMLPRSTCGSFATRPDNLLPRIWAAPTASYLDGGRNRLARIIVDGRHPIRIGQTFLRVRELHHTVERERVARPEWRILPIVLTVTLGLSILGFYALKVWLAQTSEFRASSYLTPQLG